MFISIVVLIIFVSLFFLAISVTNLLLEISFLKKYQVPLYMIVGCIIVNTPMIGIFYNSVLKEHLNIFANFVLFLGIFIFISYILIKLIQYIFELLKKNRPKSIKLKKGSFYDNLVFTIYTSVIVLSIVFSLNIVNNYPIIRKVCNVESHDFKGLKDAYTTIECELM